MKIKELGEHYICLSVSLSHDLMISIWKRATALGLSRSQYIRQLVERDLRTRQK